MRLDDWLLQRRLNYAEAADIIGSSRVSVYYWATGQRRPNARFCARIEQVSDGAVKADDHQQAWRKREADAC